MENNPSETENKNIKEEEKKEEDIEDEYNEVDKKLSSLMMKGWTMMADSCPLDSCRCPLMKSPDGQRYCVNCESWIFEPKKRVKKRFSELVPLRNPKMKEDERQHTEISQRTTNGISNVELLPVLNMKLNYLTNKLSKETDLHLIEVILKDINLSLDAIKKVNGY
ncbi:MAG: autoantigen p27 domain-containing protein [archaeon]|nr:autoantigen p27 domain-containing protein [archaeon]